MMIYHWSDVCRIRGWISIYMMQTVSSINYVFSGKVKTRYMQMSRPGSLSGAWHLQRCKSTNLCLEKFDKALQIPRFITGEAN